MLAGELIRQLQTEIVNNGDQEIVIKLKSNVNHKSITTHDLNDSIDCVVIGKKKFIRVKGYVKNFEKAK
jgi:hypothetical protein